MLNLKFTCCLLVILAIISFYSEAQQHRYKRKKDSLKIEQRNLKHKGNKTHKNYITHLIPGLGSVRGRTISSEWSGRRILQFFDIPYAKAPSGLLRFKAPIPVTPWKHILNAEKPYQGCPTLQNLIGYEILKRKNIDAEDCLRLTVNTKSVAGNAPVMVYIHGDFLYDGSSLEAAPGYLLEENIVLVGVRYRLGPFGFLSTMSEDIPGNAGVKDVILALKWIQKHITAFGGDPTRVTLFGQVAGAALINVLTMSPEVHEGLFHRVIYHSASAFTPAFVTDNPLPSARDIGQIAGCENVNKVSALNKCLRKINATDLLEAFFSHISKANQGAFSSSSLQFVVAGPSGILPQFPTKILKSGNFRAYPTIGGSVMNAGTLILRDIYIDNLNEAIIDDSSTSGMDYVELVVTLTNGADPNETWKKYAEEEVFSPAVLKNGTFYAMIPGLIDLCGTIAFKNSVLLALKGNAQKLPNNTYLYSFDYEGEFNRYAMSKDTDAYENEEMPFELGVSLTDDNLYLFPSPRYLLINTNRDIKIAKRMVAFWTSFAATGRPSAPNVPEWPAMNVDKTGPYIKIGKTISIGENYIDEFTSAVKEAAKGFNLINEEFFDNFADISDDETEADQDNKEGRNNIILIARTPKHH